MERNKVFHGDCLEVMRDIPNQSIDMILCDLPYGTTACKWDSIIPLDAMWRELKRVIKPRGAIVLMAAQPFTSALVMSQIDIFRYQWVWVKNRGTNFTNAKKQPIRKYEDILVFCKSTTRYFPQGIKLANIKNTNSVSAGGNTLRGVIQDSKGKGALRTPGKIYIQEFRDR